MSAWGRQDASAAQENGVSRLHIAFLLTQSLDSPSGLGRYGPLARSMARRGHRMEIYALHPNYSKEISMPFEQDGVRVQYVAPMHVRKDGNHKSYYSTSDLLRITASASMRLFVAGLRSQAPIVHICKPHPMNGVAGLFSAWFGSKALFVDCDDFEAGSNLFGAGWQKAIVAGFEKQIPRRSVAVTTHTHFMMDRLVEWGVSPDKIAYLPNGVEPERFQAASEEQAQSLRSRLGLKSHPVVAYIGSLSLANHPVDLLLKAFTLVRDKLPESMLLIVGGGEDFDRIREQAKSLGLGKTVIFTGRIAPEEVGAYYRLAQVSVDPVNDDDAARGRSPLKMFESWMCGTPFVTADVGDRRFLMGDPAAGALARPGDPASLANAILETLTNREKARAFSERGRQQVKQFEWNTLAESLEAFYNAARTRAR